MFKRLGSLLKLDAEARDDDCTKLSAQLQRGKDQVEYYLSGTNLERDNFFRELVTSKSVDRWIDVSVFMGCGRIKMIGISPDDLLFACSRSHFLEVSGNNIRAKDPFVSDVRRRFRTLRMSGFPTNFTSDDIYDFLLANTDQPESVLLQYSRNDDDELRFNGSANIVYYTEYAAEAALEKCLVIDEKKIVIEKLVDVETKRRKFEKAEEQRKKSKKS